MRQMKDTKRHQGALTHSSVTPQSPSLVWLNTDPKKPAHHYSWITDAPELPGDNDAQRPWSLQPIPHLYSKRRINDPTLTPICFAENFMRIYLLYKPASFPSQVVKLWIWRVGEGGGEKGNLKKKKRVLDSDKWKGARRNNCTCQGKESETAIYEGPWM